MSLKTIHIDSAARRGAIIAAAIACVLFAYFAAKWGLGNTASRRADSYEVAARTVDLAPGDPQTHYAVAVLLEKSFDSENVRKALVEYETAVALSPRNYLLWLDLGRARDRAGDREGAELALRRAGALAPNYSRVQWALGNVLLRQGKTEEAFAEIRKAAAEDPVFTDAAATSAWQIFDGDLARVRDALGDSTRLNAALAGILAAQKRFDEAIEIWSLLPTDEKKRDLTQVGISLLDRLIAANRFRLATRVAADLDAGETTAPLIGQISNGGFESVLKSQSPGPFEWQIASGQQPQIAPTSGQKHTGDHSLVLIFNTSLTSDFRAITQTVAVEPGRTYQLEVFYKSDIKTPAVFKWEVASTADGKTLAATDGTAAGADWRALTAKFTVPDAVDGVIIRLTRENCESRVCPVAGNLWFDDLRLASVN